MKSISRSIIGLTLAFAAASTGAAAVGTLSRPYSHRNLQVFLVHGESQLESRHYFTLTEAIEKRAVIVRETGNVQELTIENVSPDLTVFLHSGDIVKGGRQDRTVREDLILPPKSGRVSLATFCVENGRWTRRGNENADEFSANSKILSSRKLKMAARYGENQGEVWSGVAEQQAKLNDNVSRLAGKQVDTRSAASGSSLQLTLENKDLEAVKKAYIDALAEIVDGKTDVIGFVYCINGEINSAEVYNNRNLFRALWPKLLDSAITEAVADCPADGTTPQVSARQISTFFHTALAGATKERQLWKTTAVKTYTTPTTLLFETFDCTDGKVWVHKSFVNRGKDQVSVPLDSNSRQSIQQRERN